MRLKKFEQFINEREAFPFLLMKMKSQLEENG
jgi:hypothetical protein